MVYLFSIRTPCFIFAVPHCKERWRNLRACLTRHLKQQKVIGDGNVPHKPYYLADHMKFLLPYTKSRSSKDSVLFTVEDIDLVKNEKTVTCTSGKTDANETTTTFVSAADADNEQYVTFVHNSSDQGIHVEEATVRIPDHATIERYASPVPDSYEPEFKRTKRLSQDLDDADLNFFKSLLPDIQQMNASQKRRFKMGIFGLIDKVLTEGDCSA